MVKCQVQCMSGRIFQVEIDIISKSLIVKSMIEGMLYFSHVFHFFAYADFLYVLLLLELHCCFQSVINLFEGLPEG